MRSPIRQLLWIARRRKARVRPNRASADDDEEDGGGYSVRVYRLCQC